MAATAATQKQLLALVQAVGNGEAALRLLVDAGVAGEFSSPRSNLEKATALLRLGTNAKAPDGKTSKETDKQWALVGAKVTQSVIKLYIGAGDGASNARDVAAALELAKLALSVSCQFESLVKLGELVVENMLYQVAKKLSELPQCSSRALRIFAALHVRLWHHHESTCSALNQKTISNEKSPFAQGVDLVLAKQATLELDDLVPLCTFPTPQSFHSLQFTRFLISLVNAAVNMLLAANNHKAILEVSKRLEPWILHLSRIPGVDAKLPGSFSDRIFRVLWKCAAMVDAQKSSKTDGDSDESLEYRSLALSFMLKCPNYSNGYFIQQIHRVGVQYEKKTNPATDHNAGVSLHTFYARGANALFETRIKHGSGFKPSSIEWDYVSWLEHFALICGFQPPSGQNKGRIEALIALHHAIDHLSKPEHVNQVIRGCFQAVAASIAVEQRYSCDLSSTDRTEKEIRQIFVSDIFNSTVSPKGQDVIIGTSIFKNRKSQDTTWLKSVKWYLEGILVACDAARDVGSELSEAHLGLVLRLLRRASTRLFNASNGGVDPEDSGADTITSSIVASGDLLSSLRGCDGVQLSEALEDSFLSLEGRIRRYAVSLSAKASMAMSIENSSSYLVKIGNQVVSFQNVLDHAISDLGRQRSSLPSLMNDLQAIARETYMCATFFYKKQQYELVELSLAASFGLAENYLEQVMCNEHKAKTPSQVEAAHTTLKADALASLLAFSCRQQGKTSRSRVYHGHTILYASDPTAVAKTGGLDKYVSAIVEELQTFSDREQYQTLIDNISSLCESVASAWSARGMNQETVTSMIRLLADSFERYSSRLVDVLRLQTDAASDTTNKPAPLEKIDFCTTAEACVWKLVRKRIGCVPDQVGLAMEYVVRAIGKRKSAFCEYYVNRNSSAALVDLREARDELTQALKRLADVKDPPNVDLGGCYGWRGVFTLEICQMSGYSELGAQGSVQVPEPDCSEETALEDIRKCLTFWDDPAAEVLKRKSAQVFDSRGIAVCLDAISHALSLMSHFELESQTRTLLASIQGASQDVPSTSDVGIGLSITVLQPMHNDIAASLDTSTGSKVPSCTQNDGSGLLRLGVIDADIGLCIASAIGGDVNQARLHLSTARSAIQELRSTIKISSDDTHLYSAVAIRELAVSMAESEVIFHEGNTAEAIRKAKTALSICWKISKKVGIAEPDRDHYALPEQVKAALGKQADHTQKAPQFDFFQAIECWSWDILLAAKIILSRIAHLYALSNQPFRSSVYYAEAMALVSGVVPAVTKNQPFLEFAQLQVLAERTSHATAVHQLVTWTSESEFDADTPNNTSVILQNCEVQLQRGDLYLLEGKDDSSLGCYERALLLLGRIRFRTPVANSLFCGCYRRSLKLQLRMATVPWDEKTVDCILITLKELKKAIKKCTDLLEYALGTCQLVQASLSLLRSSTTKAFLPADKLLALIHEVYVRCDHLGIASLSHEIRYTSGLVYLMLSESRESVHSRKLDGNVAWGAAACLSSYQVIDADSSSKAHEPDRAPSSIDAFVCTLRSQIEERLPRTWLLVSITIGEASDFTISLTPTNGCEPVSFWIGKINWTAHARELSDIIEASRVTLFGNAENVAEEMTTEKKREWWTTRKELDERLQDLIVKVQGELGFWRALFTYVPEVRHSDEMTTLLRAISTTIHKGSTALTQRTSWLVSAAHAAKGTLTDSEILQLVDHIAIEENVQIRHEIASEVTQLIRSGGEPNNQNKASSTILLLHRRLEKFPWEGLDILRDRSVTRMPSIELILKNGKEHKADATPEHGRHVTALASRSSVSYLLNPAGDLKSTQSNLEPLFRRAEVTHGWKGLIGEIPDEDWMRESLLHSSLFVYCGHGSGEKYFHRDKIAALHGKGCASALLFGCSSGRLEREGVFGPHGAVVSYLVAGSPAVLAMLWDVTDKDVDLMSKDILENWLLADRQVTTGSHGELLSVALQRSRRLCKLQHLNGLAAVCYGLPLGVTSDVQSRVDTSQTKRRKLR